MAQKLAHEVGDLAMMRLEGEVTGVEKMEFRVGVVPRNASAPGGMKKGSFFPQTASTGEAITIAASKKVAFTPAKGLKDKL